MKLLPKEGALGLRVLQHWVRRDRDDVFDPFKVKVFVTQRCNLSCQHCDIGRQAADGRDELAAPQWASFWQANPELQVVSLSGGEPFLREDLEDIAIAAATGLPRLVTLTVNTNGWFTDRIVRFARNVVPRLPPRCRLIVTCSSDGPPAVHAQVRNSEASFVRKEATLTALRELAARNPTLRVRHNVNVNPWNLAGIGDYMDDLRARGDAAFISLYAASEHYGHGPDVFREVTAFRQALTRDAGLLDRLRRGQGFLGDRYLALARRFLASSGREQPLPCFSLRASVIVLHDGMVRPCIHFPADLGRVQDHGFRLGDVADAARGNALRRQIRDGACPVCWTPNEAYVSLMCNLPNPALWDDGPGSPGPS